MYLTTIFHYVESQISKCHIFHDPFDVVYDAVTSIDLLKLNYSSGKIKLKEINRETSLDDDGNYVTFLLMDIYSFTFKTINVMKSKNNNFFTLSSMSFPPFLSPFKININLYYDTIQKITVFHGSIIFEDSQNRDKITKLIDTDEIFFCKKIEDYIKSKFTKLEEVESITIKANFEKICNYFSSIENMVICFPLADPKIQYESENIIKIYSNSDKSEIKFEKVETYEENNTIKTISLNVIETNIAMPKQCIVFICEKLWEDSTCVFFKHISLEYIPFDLLESNGKSKQKILRKIKKLLEKGD